jgi:hypothetical protein
MPCLFELKYKNFHIEQKTNLPLLNWRFRKKKKETFLDIFHKKRV